MISNTELYYVKMKEFQDKRLRIMEKYEKEFQTVERFKGSKGYHDETKKLKEQCEEELTTLRNEYRPVLLTVLGGMMWVVR